MRKITESLDASTVTRFESEHYFWPNNMLQTKWNDTAKIGNKLILHTSTLLTVSFPSFTPQLCSGKYYDTRSYPCRKNNKHQTPDNDKGFGVLEYSRCALSGVIMGECSSVLYFWRSGCMVIGGKCSLLPFRCCRCEVIRRAWTMLSLRWCSCICGCRCWAWRREFS